MSRLRRILPRRIVRGVRDLQRRAQIRTIRRAHARATQVGPRPVTLLPVTLAIPVHDDADRLARLLEMAQDIGFAQIIVVDDGSPVPVVVPDDVTLIRHDTPLGPGPARNAALPHVTAPYMLFMDSDDLPTADLPALLADLAGAGPFDLCLFRHIDSYSASSGHWGQSPADEALWQAAGLSIGALQEAPRAAWPLLAQTTNYPWNRISRTAFVMDHAIACAATPVHEDIAPHWQGFAHAGRIIVSDRTCVWHMVAEAAGRQTNRSGAERLRVFDALAPAVAVTRDADMRVALLRFVLALTTWIRGMIAPAHRPAFEAALHDWLAQRARDWHDDLAARDPALLARISGEA